VDVIKAAKAGRAIVLTIHSLSLACEAPDVLLLPPLLLLLQAWILSAAAMYGT
jgi:hypothetical protein